MRDQYYRSWTNEKPGYPPEGADKVVSNEVFSISTSGEELLGGSSKIIEEVDLLNFPLQVFPETSDDNLQ